MLATYLKEKENLKELAVWVLYISVHGSREAVLRRPVPRLEHAFEEKVSGRLLCQKSSSKYRLVCRSRGFEVQ